MPDNRGGPESFPADLLGFPDSFRVAAGGGVSGISGRFVALNQKAYGFYKGGSNYGLCSTTVSLHGFRLDGIFRLSMTQEPAGASCIFANLPFKRWRNNPDET